MADSQPVFSAAAAAAEVVEFGSTVLRSAWRLEHLQTLRDAISAFQDRRGERIRAGALGPGERMYHTHGAGTFDHLAAQGMVDPTILTEMFRGSDYEKLCQAYFDDDEFWTQDTRLGFRIHDPLKSGRSFVPFHQDSGTQDPSIPRVMNCWIPLDPAGRDAPGLEVVRTPSSPAFPLKEFGLESENAAYDLITIDPKVIEAEFGGLLLAPEFEVGDGFAFSQDVIHRTHVTPQMTRPRMNFEFRVFARKALKPGVDAEQVLKRCRRVV
jgi:hypothetical protein